MGGRPLLWGFLLTTAQRRLKWVGQSCYSRPPAALLEAFVRPVRDLQGVSWAWGGGGGCFPAGCTPSTWKEAESWGADPQGQEAG